MGRPRVVGVIVILVIGLALLAGGTARAAAPVAAANAWRPGIAIVWPHDGAGQPVPLEDAPLVNVSVWPRASVPCMVPPDGLKLYLAVGNNPAAPVDQIPALLLRDQEGRFFPTLEYNDIPVQRDAQGRVDMRFYVRQWASYSNVWVHAEDGRTTRPEPLIVNRDDSPRALPPSVFIQRAFPHDAQGTLVAVDQAPQVNLATEVIATDDRGQLQPVAGFTPFERTRSFIQVLAAPGNEPLRPLSGIRPAISTTSRISQQGVLPNGAPVASFYETQEQQFNNIPVDPAQPTHFLIDTGKLALPSTIWSHASDARTLLPSPEMPPQCVGSADTR